MLKRFFMCILLGLGAANTLTGDDIAAALMFLGVAVLWPRDVADSDYKPASANTLTFKTWEDSQ
jgi:hypothetical protein